MVLGIRPSLVHAYGITAGVPADNLTDPGIASWRSSLAILALDLDGASAHALAPRDSWIRDWIRTELDRDARRWTDPSSALRILALALGPDAAARDGVVGRSFWLQWQRNLAHLVDLLDFGVAVPSPDTEELIVHCRHAAELDLAPGGVITVFEHLSRAVAAADWAHADRTQRTSAERDSAERTSAERGDVGVFRPLATEVERIYLSDVVALSLANADTCRAAQTRFYNPGTEVRRACTAGRTKRGLQAVGPRRRMGD